MERRLLRSLLVVLTLSTWPAMARDWLIPKDQQRSYGLVKADLLAQGWKPFKARREFETGYYCGADGRHCREFPETLWCQLAGKPSCTMGFYKPASGQYLVVRGNLAEEPSETMMVDEIVTPGKKIIEQWFLGRGRKLRAN